MATSIPEEFEGEPTLPAWKIKVLKEWYTSCLGDSDKADNEADSIYYTAQSESFRACLILLYGDDIEAIAAAIDGPLEEKES
jgi:hypothetical protein